MTDTATNLQGAADRIAGLMSSGDDAAQASPTDEERARAPAREADDTARDEQATSDESENGPDDLEDSGDAEDENLDTETADDDAEAADPGDEVGDDDAPSTDGITTLDDALEAIGLDDSLTVSIRADGEDHEVSIAELKKGYQRDAYMRRVTQEVAEERRSMQKEREAQNEAVQRDFAIAHQALAGLDQMFAQAQSDPGLRALETSNPTQYLMQIRAIEQQRSALQRNIQQLSQQYDQYLARQKEQSEAELVERQQKERRALEQAMPGLTAEKRQAIAKAAVSLGYTPEEISEIWDHRWVIAMHGYAQNLERQQIGAKARKKITKLPTRVGKKKASAPATEAQRKAAARQKARAKVKKTGKMTDAADAIAAQLNL